MENCRICDSKETKVLIELGDDRYNYHGHFKLFQCLNCKHVWQPKKYSEEELSDMYTNYYVRSTFNIEDFKPVPEIKGFKGWFNGERCNAYSWVSKNTKVLDIGCGFGETLEYHKNRGCEVFGVEADQNILKVAEKYNLNVKVGLFNKSNYQPDSFDYITMDQVIEHVEDVTKTLKDVSFILKKGGTIILSTPNVKGWGVKVFGKKWINWHLPYHLNFLTKKSLEISAKEAGLKIIKYKTITNSEWLYFQELHLIFYPKKNTKSKFWTPGQKIDLFHKIISKIIRLIHITKINHLITRFFDFLGKGDCILIILQKSE